LNSQNANAATNRDGSERLVCKRSILRDMPMSALTACRHAGPTLDDARASARGHAAAEPTCQRARRSNPAVDRYIGLLVDLRLIRRLPPWSENVGKRLVRVRSSTRAAGTLRPAKSEDLECQGAFRAPVNRCRGRVRPGQARRWWPGPSSPPSGCPPPCGSSGLRPADRAAPAGAKPPASTDLAASDR
jgi:hypothetical protein